MADIFVNYRHEDGDAAGRLADRLCDEFDTLIDTAMESGDSISAEISNALRDTRIFLAVIGKEWLNKKNLRRLHQPKDWIRREFLEVLGRADVRLVPVLVHKDLDMPKQEMLPPELAEFTDKRAERLRYDTWREDLNHLIESIRSWLSVARPPRASGTGMPSDVPFLCDRAEQEYDLAQLAADLQRTRSLICILHGHKWEAHVKFISRLSQLGLLDKLFGAGAAGVGQSFLDWNSSLAGAQRFDELIRYAIKSNVMQNPLARTRS